jgi:hypothetical protein
MFYNTAKNMPHYAHAMVGILKVAASELIAAFLVF